MAQFDRGEKWLLETHGDVLLRVAGVTGIRSCRAVANEVVDVSRIPDGLLEVELEGHDQPVPHLIEIGTFADRRMEEQMLYDIALTTAARKAVSEAIAVALRPRVTYDLKSETTLSSPSGRTSLSGC
jgi:hypothetical protein